MPLISFSGETSQGPFWRQIIEGRKIHTCREPRKYPIVKGLPLHLYWKCRTPRRKKPVHFIGLKSCIKVVKRPYNYFAYNDVFAHNDGFSNHEELQDWFGSPARHGDKVYDVIHWSPFVKLTANGRKVLNAYFEDLQEVASVYFTDVSLQNIILALNAIGDLEGFDITDIMSLYFKGVNQ